MTSSAPSLYLSHPSPGWSAATQRVESYLRAHRIAPGETAQLAKAIMAEARAQHRAGVEPMAAAMAVAADRIAKWHSAPSHKALVGSPEIQLSHMAGESTKFPFFPALTPKAAATYQRSLVKISNVLVLALSLGGATWAALR